PASSYAPTSPLRVHSFCVRHSFQCRAAGSGGRGVCAGRCYSFARGLRRWTQATYLVAGDFRPLCVPSSPLGACTEHSVRTELFDRVLLLDSFAIDPLDPQVVLGLPAPEIRVAPQPAPRVALAHLDQRGYELLVEQQE